MDVTLQHIATVIAALSSAGLFKFVQWAIGEVRKARKAEIEEAIEAALQRERAEQYQRESKATIEQKNRELELSRLEKKELREALDRLADIELPRLQRSVDQKDSVIDRLSRSYEALSERITS